MDKNEDKNESLAGSIRAVFLEQVRRLDKEQAEYDSRQEAYGYVAEKALAVETFAKKCKTLAQALPGMLSDPDKTEDFRGNLAALELAAKNLAVYGVELAAVSDRAYMAADSNYVFDFSGEAEA